MRSSPEGISRQPPATSSLLVFSAPCSMSPQLLVSLRLKNQVPYPYSPRFIYVFVYLSSLSLVRISQFVKQISYGLEGSGVWIRIEARDNLSCKPSKGVLGPTQHPIPWVTVFFSGIKRRERDVNHSHFSAVIKNKWSYTFTASACLHGVGNESFKFKFICL